jgi:hypothetical protein
MGRSSGDWDFSPALLDVPALFEAHAALLAANGWMSPFLLVGIDPTAASQHVFLDRGAPSGDGDAMVVRMRPGHEAHRTPLYVGLVEMLHVEAFRGVRLPQLAHVQQRPVLDFDATCAHAGALGLERLPGTTRCALFDRGDAALLVERSPRSEKASLTVGAVDAALLAAI